MSGESHTLWLELIDPPDLLMASGGPEQLIARVKRAQADTRKQPGLSEMERAARLGDLYKIEAQALLVLKAAQEVEAESPSLRPSVPGFKDLAWLIHGYGKRYRTTDLAAALATAAGDPVAARIAEVGEARVKYTSVLNRRALLRSDLSDLEQTLASAKKISRALQGRIDAFQARLAQLQEVDAISQARRTGAITEVSPTRRTANYYDVVAGVVPDPPAVLEFPDGSRVWRDVARGPLRHEATLGPSTGRAGMERLKYTATEHGNLPAGPQYERAHSLGQGTGFESPYGIFYAPRVVNQTLQNKGIELYMRQIAAEAEPGEIYRVATKTRAHDATLRLARIDYSITRVAGGRSEEVARYFIEVTGSAEQPDVRAGAIQFSAAGQALGRRVPPPPVLTRPYPAP